MEENLHFKDEVMDGYIKMKYLDKVKKSICKINYDKYHGSGFFMKVSDSLKCLFTNYHVLNPTVSHFEIKIEIWNENYMSLNMKNRSIKYFNKPIDITVIEIKETDSIYRDIEFLNYDSNYQQGYSIYNKQNVFSIHYPLGNDSACASGKIIEIKDFQFFHTIPTAMGCSGCPIILLNYNNDFIPVIGIHLGGDKEKKINGGTFIGVVINEINNDLIKKHNIKAESNENKLEDLERQNIENNNYIISEIDIKENKYLNKEINILNSYEEYMRKGRKKIDLELEKDLKNEEEIKECEITINGKLIPFNYYHQFKMKGIYTIKYTFKKHLSKVNHMFYKCSLLTSIDLSNLNTINISNMSEMFYECSSLKNINLSNLNTQNVTNMSKMFFDCKSLTSLDLSNIKNKNVINIREMFSLCKSLIDLKISNFNTQNINNTSKLFYQCSSLINLDLSNFDTKNVINMSQMFYDCKSLTSLDLSKFNTEKVDQMNQMFYGCKSLININLSNFNTKNVIKMGEMFSGCSALKNINLSNFYTPNVDDINKMFYGCSQLTNLDLSNFDTKLFVNKMNIFSGCLSLKKENVTTKDQRIIEELIKLPEQKSDNCIII